MENIILKNIQTIREDYEALKNKINDKQLVYLDNAATTLKPNCLSKKIFNHYNLEASNIHRGAHFLSEQATDNYEKTRESARNFINANNNHEIIFTRGTTESINLLANTLGRSLLKKGDTVLISHMEHHSNIIPWQVLRDELGIILKIVPVDSNGDIIIEEYKSLLCENNVKLASIVQASNSLGTINPIKELIDLAHQHDSLFLVDAAQSVPHMPVDVQNLNCDFLTFSGHKMYGPTGVGVLYGKEELLEKLPPYQTGGGMIEKVTFEKTKYHHLPYKFEAGTPAIAEVIALKTAFDYINKFDIEQIYQYEDILLKYALKRLSDFPGCKIIGTSKNKIGIISFILDGVHPHDVGSFADKEGIALRTGHHCTQPIMDFFEVPATTRASFALYNTKEEVDYLIETLHKIVRFFR